MEHIFKVLKIKKEQIIIIGRLIECSVSIEMSIKYKKIKSVILRSAFTSICDFIKEKMTERFRNMEKINKVVCPTLFINGKDDNLGNYRHSIELMKECQGQFIWNYLMK
ncbi:unnamed protein product [Paramecium sonneborni]|uniref:Uncharacterized protein n=1 Tax=Paramecium sonneborni TaxID=65129 RepID=A0A8S1RQ88_9CILI|nr:unnamed protein product [Paramecium sonneborni]